MHSRPSRARVIRAFFGAVYAVGGATGPLLGGVITDKASWRWAFYINLPIGIAVMPIVIWLVKLKPPAGGIREKLKRVDYLGAFLIIGFCVSLMLPISWGSTSLAWDSPVIIALFCAFFVLFGLFVWVERSIAPEPIIPLRLFRIPSIACSCIGNFLLGWALIVTFYYLPVFYQVTLASEQKQQQLGRRLISLPSSRQSAVFRP